MANNNVIQIAHVLPAPGWKAFVCAIDSGTNKAEFWEVPVVGWAVVRNLYSDGPEDVIKLFVFDDDTTRAIDESFNEDDRTVAIAPGEEFNEKRKAHLEERVRRGMARAARKAVAS